MSWHQIGTHKTGMVLFCGDDPVEILSMAMRHVELLWFSEWGRWPTQEEIEMSWQGAQEGHIFYDPTTNPQSSEGETRACKRCGKMMCQCSPRGGLRKSGAGELDQGLDSPAGGRRHNPRRDEKGYITFLTRSPEPLLEAMDRLVDNKRFKSRTELVNHVMTEFIEKERKERP